MKARIGKLLTNDLFIIFFNGTIIELAFMAVILATFQVPPEAILDSGLKEILMIFEG